MTTDIRIRVNGNYIAEGNIAIRRRAPNLGEGGTSENREVKVSGVGSKEAVEETINIPHDCEVALSLSERPATQDEIDEAAQKAAEGSQAE